MFENIKLLKQLKIESYNIDNEDNEVLNERGEAVICVECEDKNDIVSKFSCGDNATITSEFSNFLKENTEDLDIEKSLNLKIHSNNEFSNEDKSQIKLAIRNHYTKTLSDVNKRLYQNKAECIILSILSVIFMLIYVVSKFFDPYEISSELILIIVWVFMWRAIENIAFERRELRKRAIKLYRLLNARIEFYR